jgi:hypothetical protein
VVVSSHDKTADRLIGAMKADEQRLRDVRAALRALLEAGCSAEVLVPETDAIMQNKITLMSVEYRKIDGLDQRVLVA